MTAEPWDDEAQLGLANDFLAMSEDAAYVDPQKVFASASRHIEQMDEEHPRVLVIISGPEGFWFNHTGGTPNSVLGELTRFAHQMIHADEDDD